MSLRAVRAPVSRRALPANRPCETPDEAHGRVPHGGSHRGDNRDAILCLRLCAEPGRSLIMLPATPVSVPLTAGSLALLDTPEYGEDPCAMLLRRNLDSPHCMEDPNVPNRDDDDASSRRSSMDADEETDADETSQHPGEPAVHFDATNGSFVAYLAPMGPLGTHDNGQFADTFASHLANGQARRVGDRGAVAHDRGVQVCTNQNRVVLFRGVLRNKKKLAKELGLAQSLPNAAGESCKSQISCAELVERLYDQHGVGFVDNLEGFWAFAIVDADCAGGHVFAATDRHGTLPLLKGRCPLGGIVVAHCGVCSDGGGDSSQDTHNTCTRIKGVLDRQMVGGASVVPPGTYVLGNRHCRAHKYCRSADHERALEEMRSRDLSYASLGELTGSEKTSSVYGALAHRAPPGAAARSREHSFSDLRNASPARRELTIVSSCEKEKTRHRFVEPVASRCAAISRRSSVKELEGWDLGENLGVWSSKAASDDAEEFEMQCESRMGAAFREAEQARAASVAVEIANVRIESVDTFRKNASSSPEDSDFLSRLGSGASDQSAVKHFVTQAGGSPRGHKRYGPYGHSLFDTFERDESECFVSLRG